jgi:Fe-S-cluster containining protein
MRRSVTAKDMTTFSKLDMIYNQVRIIESKQNNAEYKCLGSGLCCRIGLRIPLAECANIAYRLTQDFYFKMESEGEDVANEWMETMIESLKEAMHDPNWNVDGETERHCVFYKGGCTIYRYRPMVCRTFGTVTPVDDYCPRIRNAHGQVDYFAGEGVARVIKQYQDILAEYANDKDKSYNSVVYMPLGILSFLLDPDQLAQLADETEPKFWDGVRGWYNYRLTFTKMHGYDYNTLGKHAEKDGEVLGFKDE